MSVHDDLDWAQTHPSPSKHATEKEQLLLQVRATIEFGFGSMCDFIEDSLKDKVDEHVIETIKRQVRTRGNNAIRHIENHAQNYNISRKHEKDKVNKERVLAKHLKRNQQ